ncbi:TPA: hypothetical protein ACLGML_004274 [Salmonella enterica]
MPQLARAQASLRRPGASQQDGALYCACEHQRTPREFFRGNYRFAVRRVFLLRQLLFSSG